MMGSRVSEGCQSARLASTLRLISHYEKDADLNTLVKAASSSLRRFVAVSLSDNVTI
jgi:hypothetical protein